MNTYSKQIMNIPKISIEEERKLVKEIKEGNIKSRNKLIESKMYLVLYVLNNYKQNKNYQDVITESNLDEFISYGVEALIQASEAYNHSNKLSFDSYAKMRISVYFDRVFARKRALLNKESKDFPDIVEEDHTKDVDNLISLKKDIEDVLNKNELDVIYHQYELFGNSYKTLQTLASEKNISYQRIIQIKEKALIKISTSLRNSLKEERRRLNNLTLEPLYSYLYNSSEMDILTSIEELSIKNKDYYELLINTYKNGFDKCAKAKDILEKYTIEFKVVKEIRNLIIINNDRKAIIKNNERNKKMITEPFNLTCQDIVNSEIFNSVLEDFNEIDKKVIYFKFILGYKEEEISSLLSLDLDTINNTIMNFLKVYQIKINECFKNNLDIIYTPTFINKKLVDRIFSTMGGNYQEILNMRFNGYSEDDIIIASGLNKSALENLLNSFMQLYLQYINFYIDNYQVEYMKKVNNTLKK